MAEAIQGRRDFGHLAGQPGDRERGRIGRGRALLRDDNLARLREGGAGVTLAPQREREGHGAHVGAAVREPERAGDASAASANRLEREGFRHARSAGRDRAVVLRGAGTQHTADGQQRGDQIGRGGSADVLEGERDGNDFAGIHHAIAGRAVFRRQSGASRRNHRRLAGFRVVDHQGKILIQRIGVVGHAIGDDVRRRDGGDEVTGDAGRQEKAFHVVPGIRIATGDGMSAAEDVATIRVAAHGDHQVEIVVVSIAGGGTGRVRPRQRDPERPAGILDGADDGAHLAAGGEFIGGRLFPHDAGGVIEGHAEVHAAKPLRAGG